MHLPAMLIALPLLCLAAAAPLADPNPKPLDQRATPKYYYLRISGGAGHNFNGMYLSAYHTGAGLNDATFVSGKKYASKGYINGTHQLFDLGTTFPWAMIVGGDANYAGWESTAINAGSGENFAHFSISKSLGLVWTTDKSKPALNEFKSWLVCNWFHNVPQLFWKNRFYDYPDTSNCATVKLVPEYL